MLGAELWQASDIPPVRSLCWRHAYLQRKKVDRPTFDVQKNSEDQLHRRRKQIIRRETFFGFVLSCSSCGDYAVDVKIKASFFFLSFFFSLFLWGEGGDVSSFLCFFVCCNVYTFLLISACLLWLVGELDAWLTARWAAKYYRCIAPSQSPSPSSHLRRGDVKGPHVIRHHDVRQVRF